MENRESKYLAFEDSFKSSGLSQKAYSKHKGISPSMVSYYLGKARELRKTKDAVSSRISEIRIDRATRPR